jgi:hypothetical protein
VLSSIVFNILFFISTESLDKNGTVLSSPGLSAAEHEQIMSTAVINTHFIQADLNITAANSRISV